MKNIPSGFEIPDKLADVQYIQPVFDTDIDSSESSDYGSYKLSKKIIERMMSKKLLINGEEIPNVTPSELILLFSLPAYASSKGIITDFSIKEGSLYIKEGCMCEKSIYNALAGLKKKQYIDINKKGCGLYDIIILDNDFSDPSSYKYGYLNTNRDCFIPGKKKHDIFLSLPLGAKKIYLILSFYYRKNRGWVKSSDELKDLLDLKDRCLIYRYLDLIKPLIDNEIIELKDHLSQYSHKGLTTDQRIRLGKELWANYQNGLKSNISTNFNPSSETDNKINYWMIKKKTYRSRSPILLFKTGINTLDANNGVDIDQISYTKRMFSKFVYDHHIEFSERTNLGLISKNEELNFLFLTLKSFAPSLGYIYVRDTIFHMLIMYGNILSANFWSAKYLKEQLKNKIAQ